MEPLPSPAVASRRRTTVDVSRLREIANDMLEQPGHSKDAREAVCVFIERILMDTGNYRGFGYQQPTSSDDFDDTRRVYYGR